MRLSDLQRRTMLAGAVLMLLAVPLLVGVALFAGGGDPEGPGVAAVEGAERVPLPDPPLLGGEVVVYGATGQPGTPARDLGCRLVTRSGSELSAAKLSHLAVLGSAPVEVGGEQLQPLFAVRGWTDGGSVVCSGAAAVAPLAVSSPSTFGLLGPAVRLAAAGAAVLFAVVGAVGVVVLRRR